MNLTIGQMIKKLRKERNWTQEELAEILNVTSQAVSKWENETGIPDISQVVPLATIFGVSTDVLFGMCDTSAEEEVQKMISESTKGEDKFQIKIAYDKLQEGLKKYPSNNRLLMQSLELGITLAYPENDTYYKEHCKEIYSQCIRQANLVISHSRDINCVMRARMILVILHSAYGNFDEAWKQAQEFPNRADMTVYDMSAYVAHARRDTDSELTYLRMSFLYLWEALLDNITALGSAYRAKGQASDALTVLASSFKLNDIIFEDEEIIPPEHVRELGDLHTLISEVYLEIGDRDSAILWLEKMADYDIKVRKLFDNKKRVNTPFLRSVDFPFYHVQDNIRNKLLEKLNDIKLSAISDDYRFKELLARI